MTKPRIPAPPPPAAILLYQTEDGQTRLDVTLRDDTVWLSLNQLADLFQRDKSVISRHIKNIFDEGELVPEATVANFATVQPEGDRTVERQVEHFNLDVIISVGYRVKSHRGTQFRIWATQRLRDYLVKGFVLDDDRFKRGGGSNYFDELLARIRDIPSTERVFWKKVLDIYATSIDYDPRAEPTRRFFQAVQNKMHWAAHGHTAAEVVATRADASKPNMGLASWYGQRPRRADVTLAKNYLDAGEIDILNRIVSMYLDFAELQAVSQRPMYMRDWIAKLDQFLQVSDRPALDHLGSVSHEVAAAKAELEFRRYSATLGDETSTVEQHFAAAVAQTKALAASASPIRSTRRKKPQP